MLRALRAGPAADVGVRARLAAGPPAEGVIDPLAREAVDDLRTLGREGRGANQEALKRQSEDNQNTIRRQLDGAGRRRVSAGGSHLQVVHALAEEKAGSAELLARDGRAALNPGGAHLQASAPYGACSGVEGAVEGAAEGAVEEAVWKGLWKGLVGRGAEAGRVASSRAHIGLAPSAQPSDEGLRQHREAQPALKLGLGDKLIVQVCWPRAAERPRVV